MQPLGLSKQYGKKDSEVSQFLKSATALRWNFYPILRTTREWNSFATTCYKVVLMQTPLFLCLFGPNVLHRQ